MGFDREKRGLYQRKMEKPQVKKHTPLKSEGNTGSLSIRNVAGGVFLFFKGIGEWFKLFNSRNHMIPDVHGVYNIGSSDKRWKSLFVTDKSLNIGDTKANSVVLGTKGIGDSIKLDIKTSTGMTIVDDNEPLQVVDGDITITSTSAVSFGIDSTIVESGNTFTIASGATFSIIEPSVDVYSIENDINTNATNITLNQAKITTNQSDIVSLERTSAESEFNIKNILNDIGKIKEDLDEFKKAYIALRYELLRNTQDVDTAKYTTHLENNSVHEVLL